MPQIKRNVPYDYDSAIIYDIRAVTNAYAQAIDFLNDKIEELEKQIEELKHGWKGIYRAVQTASANGSKIETVKKRIRGL